MTCDLIDPDDDNDGIIDINDLFPKDGSEWEDLNGDGLGDNKYPLTLLDKIKLNSNVIIPIVAVIITVIALISFILSRKINNAEELQEDLEKYDDFNIDFELDKNTELNENIIEKQDERQRNVDNQSEGEAYLEKFDEYPGWLWDSTNEEWVPEE